MRVSEIHYHLIYMHIELNFLLRACLYANYVENLWIPNPLYLNAHLDYLINSCLCFHFPERVFVCVCVLPMGSHVSLFNLALFKRGIISQTSVGVIAVVTSNLTSSTLHDTGRDCVHVENCDQIRAGSSVQKHIEITGTEEVTWAVGVWIYVVK